MAEDSNWQEVKRQAFEAYAKKGSMDADELGEVIEGGCAGDGFDEHEKIVLIQIISSLTRADLSDAMWARVDELINKFDLGHDSDATIERLEDEHEHDLEV